MVAPDWSQYSSPPVVLPILAAGMGETEHPNIATVGNTFRQLVGRAPHGLVLAAARSTARVRALGIAQAVEETHTGQKRPVRALGTRP